MPQQNKHSPEPGDDMEDGTIFGGIHPETGKEMYFTVLDKWGPNPVHYSGYPGSLCEKFNWWQAMKHASELKIDGFDECHLVTPQEIKTIYRNMELSRIFHTTAFTGIFYWTSQEGPNIEVGTASSFYRGNLHNLYKDGDGAIMVVCTKPGSGQKNPSL